jgi:hypothetical protein
MMMNPETHHALLWTYPMTMIPETRLATKLNICNICLCMIILT